MSRQLHELPAWRALLIAAVAWCFRRWPFREPGKIGAYRDLVEKR